METLKIDILNPKVKSILKDLAKLNLIRIRKDSDEIKFEEILKNLRAKAETAPSLEDIKKEVEEVRKIRYEKGKSNS